MLVKQDKIMNVKTTRIEKKYKDKKTGEYKSLTIEHAKVKDRLKAFWEDSPRGKIETSSVKDSETITFKTFILADKSNEYSREATGHAQATLPLGEKDYEKLETISVGRALALLGYATDGEVASFEEMQDFLNEKDKKKLDMIENTKMEVSAITDIETLKKYYRENSGKGKEVALIITTRAEQIKNGN